MRAGCSTLTIARTQIGKHDTKRNRPKFSATGTGPGANRSLTIIPGLSEINIRYAMRFSQPHATGDVYPTVRYSNWRSRVRLAALAATQRLLGCCDRGLVDRVCKIDGLGKVAYLAHDKEVHWPIALIPIALA
jgi:hypothetical protein